MSNHLHRRVTISAAVLGAVALVGAPPAAASSPQEFNGGYRDRIDLAAAIWRTDTETSTASLEVLAFERTVKQLGGTTETSGPVLDLFYDHSELDAEAGVHVQTSYQGSTGDGLVFDLDPSLRSGAHVSDTVELTGWRCVHPVGEPGPGEDASDEQPASDCVALPSVTVEVDLAWTRTGAVTRDVERLGGVVPPEFQAHARTVTAAADAVVTGQVAGDGLRLADGPASHGFLVRSGYVEHLLVR